MNTPESRDPFPPGAGWFSKFFWTWLHRSDASVSWRWAGCSAFVLGFTALAGTIGSSLAIGCGMVALAYWLLDPQRFAFNRRERLISYICLAYFLVVVAFSFTRPDTFGALNVSQKIFPLVLMLPLMPALREFYQDYWDRWVAIGLIAGGVCAGLFAIGYAALYAPLRVEALSGNALLFAYLCAALVLFNLILSSVSRNQVRTGFLLAAMFAYIAVVLSGSRGILLIITLLVALIVFLNMIDHYRRSGVRAFRLAAVNVAVIGGLLAALYGAGAFTIVESRFEHFRDTITGEAGQNPEESTSLRLSLMRASVSAFMSNPVVGYGRQHVIQAANDQFPDDPEYGFTHLHNAYLSDAVGSGIAGLLAYCAVLLTPLIASAGLPRHLRQIAIFYALLVAADGLLNIGFYHDITASYFGYAVCFLASRRRQGDRQWEPQPEPRAGAG